MKKNAERIIFILLFFIGLILIFFLCSSQLKAEFIRTYDLIQDGEISKSFDGTGELKVKTIDVSDTITTDTITAAQLNIINIDITTLSGTSAILNSITVSDTADITDLTADTITANKIVSETLNEYIKKTDSIYADSILTTQSKIIYVDKNRTDNYIADGTILKPYKTIQDAINIIAALETSNYCAIEIATGNYTENLIFEDSRLQRISLIGKGKVYINPVAGYAIKSETENDSLYSLNLDNIIISKPILITAANNNSEAFTDMLWNNISFTGTSNLSVNSINSLTLRNCYSEQSNSFSFSNINWLLLANSNFQGNLSIENTTTKNIPSWGIYNAQIHAYSTYYSGNISYTADTNIEIVLNGCRWGWGNLTIPDSITIYAHNSYLRGNIINQGTVYLRNSQCQSITGGNIIYQNFDYQISNTSNKSGNTIKDALDNSLSKVDSISGDSIISLNYSKINNKPFIPDTTPYLLKSDSIVITKVSQLTNDSNFTSYNDTLFFQVSNSDTIYADTSITADTQMDVINDTACFVIYGDSYGVNLMDFEFAYKIKTNGVWLESSQLVYFDEANKRVVFKADINTFAPNTIKFNFWRVKK